MLSNAKELLPTEWADKIDVELEGVPADDGFSQLGAR